MIMSRDSTAKPLLFGVFLGGASERPFRVKLIEQLRRDLNAIIYFFPPNEINYRDYVIQGVYYNPSRDRWARRIFPFPNILYLHGGLEKLNQKELKLFHSAVMACKVRIVKSPLEFNKWEVYQALKSNYGMKAHLPETRLFQKNYSELKAMLCQYGGVYLKACRGRRGQQVMSVTLLPGNAYECRYFLEKPISKTFKTFSGLSGIIKEFFKNRDLIVQQPIDLIQYQGKKVDLRAEVQRNGMGELEVVGVPVRVALENSPITTHASSFRFEDFFTGMMEYDNTALRQLRRWLFYLLFKIYRSMEEVYGPLGEMGIDIGLDKKGKLWVIECNALSAMVSFVNAYDEKTVLRAFSNSLEYTLFKLNRINLID